MMIQKDRMSIDLRIDHPRRSDGRRTVDTVEDFDIESVEFEIVED